MTSPRHPHFVVAFDFSLGSDHALRRAIEVASITPGQSLHVIAVLDHRRGLSVLETPSVDVAYADKIQELVVDRVVAALAERGPASAIEFFVHARIGNAADEILALAREVGADQVFCGSHGSTGLERLLLGSVSARIVREAGCTVMVVRPKGYKEVELLHIVAAPASHHAYRPPLRFAYADRSSITRSNDWPIS